jgi:predicted DNA-binding protein with PD1-like motif
MKKGKVGAMCAFRLPQDEDLFDGIIKSVEESGVKAGVFFVIGALKHMIAGCLKEGEYKLIEVEGPLEIASCMGNVAVDERGKIAIHAHLLASNEKGESFGGHLMKGSIVGVTAELIIIEVLNIKMKRVTSQKTKFKLLELDQ